MPDDGVRHELLRGELRELTKPGFEHGRVAATIGMLLAVHARQTGGGVTVAAETGFLLARNPDTVRAPDAAFISKKRADDVGRTVKFWPGAPDLAVEVVSPSDTFHEVQDKALEWLAAGATAVLVLDPIVLDPTRRTATVYRGPDDVRVHDADESLDLGDAVPGFSVAVAEFFA